MLRVHSLVESFYLKLESRVSAAQARLFLAAAAVLLPPWYSAILVRQAAQGRVSKASCSCPVEGYPQEFSIVTISALPQIEAVVRARTVIIHCGARRTRTGLSTARLLSGRAARSIMMFSKLVGSCKVALGMMADVTIDFLQLGSSDSLTQ